MYTLNTKIRTSMIKSIPNSMSNSTDASISPLDESILKNAGQFTLHILADLIVLTLFYGIFIVLFSVSLYTMIRRGLRTRANWAAVIGTSVNFAIMTVEWIMLLTWLIFILQILLIHNGNLSLTDRLSLEHKTENHFVLAIDNLASVPLLISDAFVVWRTSVLFTGNWRPMTIPIICLACTIGLFIAETAVSMETIAGTAVNWALLALSLATNLISTGMIGWRLWIYRKRVLPHLGKTKSPVHQVIITLVESGAVFCLIQIISIIIPIVSGDESSANPSMVITVTQQIIFSLAAMYPTFILLICRNESSRVDEIASLSMNLGNGVQFATIQASESRSMAISELYFAHGSSQSSTLEAKANTSGQ